MRSIVLAEPIANGTEIGDYRVIRHLGSGGTASVYLVEDGKGAKAAMKVSCGDEAEGILANEGAALMMIKHPNIIRMLSAGGTEDAIYLILEYFEGINAGEHISRHGPFPWKIAADAAIGLSNALHAVHREGFLHRDVKPGNMHIGPDGKITLFDFGLSCMQDDLGPEEEGFIVGTPAFIAPEILRGMKPTIRSDIYGAGVTLYALICGVTPYYGLSDLFSSILHGDVLPPGKRFPRLGVPEWLDGVVMRAIAREPDGRFKAVSEMGAQLSEGMKSA